MSSIRTVAGARGVVVCERLLLLGAKRTRAEDWAYRLLTKGVLHGRIST